MSSLVSPSDLKGIYIRDVGASVTTEDTTLQVFCDAASALLARVCGYVPASVSAAPTMLSTSYTLYLDARGESEISLPCSPITTVSSFYDDPGHLWQSGNLLSSSDYEVDPQAPHVIRLLRSGQHPTVSGDPWHPAKRALKIAVTAGFGTVPADLKDACALQVKAMWESRASASKDRDQRKPTIASAVRERLAAYILPSAWVGV